MSPLEWLPFSQTIRTVSADLARKIVLGQLPTLSHGTLVIHEPDGSKNVYGASLVSKITTSIISEEEKLKRTPVVELRIRSPAAWTRMLFANDIGFAEAYMLGEITCDDLTAFFRLFILNASVFTHASALLSTINNTLTAPLYRLTNTTEQALLNAQSHYSLSNDVFASFLDPTMTYSAPLWLQLSDPASSTDTLETAQRRKLTYTIASARIKASDHVLEIGTGWGAFAIEAVGQTGCRVTTITLSSEQAILANERIRKAGLEKSIEVLVCDYRHVPLARNATEKYDKIVSIEMIEHVGPGFLDTYFQCIDRYLKVEGGIAVFQVITIPEARYEGYKSRSDFIQRYIFPGGHLPTVSGMVSSIDRASKGRLVVESITSVSGHYVRALREWREKFLAISDSDLANALKGTISHSVDIGLFRRKWEYYFCYCEAGFATKTLGDVSITVGREGATELIDDIPM
jgi:cyclopropane-fatty-acyl-phospholipid synthase